jgi:hypothetical protein
MKKLLTLVLIICIGGICSNAFGQETKTKNKKSGFAVGGYDNTRQEKEQVTKRSIEIPEDAEKEDKAMEVEQEAPPVPAQAPSEAKAQEENTGNAYGKNKDGLEGKDFGQTGSQNAKDNQRPKKNTKSKGRRR